MIGAGPDPLAVRPRVVVAGHICVDVIPELPSDRRGRAFRPGSLDIIGPAALAVGGCVGNTGIALHRLGLPTTLVARVGADVLGDVLTDLVGAAVPAGDVRLLRKPGTQTSYSLVVNRNGEDRAIAHFAGVNDTFVADDVPAEILQGAALVHVGYPPLMAAMIAREGHELAGLLARAHAAGAVTSVDMANANLDPGEGRVRWRALLERVLPMVDVFMPSLDEACHLLGRRVRRVEGGAPSREGVARLAGELVDLGVAIAGIKLGEHGLYVRCAAAGRLAEAGGRLSAAWADRELHSTVFESNVIGTTGAGDATIAGFLFGLVTGRTPVETVTIACAVGGSSTEAADGTSAVPAWDAIARRLRHGWRRVGAIPAPGWTATELVGLSRGPRDRPGPAGDAGTRRA